MNKVNAEIDSIQQKLKLIQRLHADLGQELLRFLVHDVLSLDKNKIQHIQQQLKKIGSESELRKRLIYLHRVKQTAAWDQNLACKMANPYFVQIYT